jgi:hypothetical protein
MLWKVKVEKGKIAHGLGLKARGGRLILGTSHSTFNIGFQIEQFRSQSTRRRFPAARRG